jgi:hypothetical protein
MNNPLGLYFGTRGKLVVYHPIEFLAGSSGREDLNDCGISPSIYFFKNGWSQC